MFNSKDEIWEMESEEAYFLMFFLYLMHIYVKRNVWVYYKSYTHSCLEKESLSEACH